MFGPDGPGFTRLALHRTSVRFPRSGGRSGGRRRDLVL